MGLQRVLFSIDRFSTWSGKIAAWLVLASTLLVSYDVVCRYLSKPFATTWFGEFIRTVWFTYTISYDMSYYLYAMLFMLGGAYALSRGQHLRGDVFYRLWPVRVQASVDLVLYLVAFAPGIISLVLVGAQWAEASWEIRERAFTSAAAPPIYPLKAVIPLAGALMLMQGFAEWIRAGVALRTGEWPRRLSDVEETETKLAQSEEL